LTERRPRFYSLFQWGLGAATGGLLIGLIASQTIHRANQRHLLTELADDHLRSLIAGHLVDASSSDRRIVGSWFEGKINFAPPVPDLSAAGYTLVGGRVDYLAGHAAAALVYQLGKHDISVFIWPEASSTETGPQDFPSERGYQIAGWTSHGLTCRAVADINEHDLRDFAAAFQSSALP
jgi:anti-sigma factor RsiW